MKIPLLSRRNEPADPNGTDNALTSADPVPPNTVDGPAPGTVGDPAPSNVARTGDGRVPSTMPGGVGDGREAAPVATDRGGERTTYRSAAASTDGLSDPAASDSRGLDGERRAEARAATARAATTRPTDPAGNDGLTRQSRDGTTDTLERTIDVDTATQSRTAGRSDLDHPDLVRADRDRSDLTRPDRDRADLDPDAADRRSPEPAVVAGKKPRASLLATLGLVVGVAGLLFVLTGTLAGYGIAVGALGAVLAVLGLMATRRRHIAGKTDALLGILAGLSAVVLGILAMTGQYDWPTTDGDVVNRFREWLDSQFIDRF